MKLVVGLGNPGPKYRNHRHNVGFMVLDQVFDTNHSGAWQSRFEGLTSDCMIGGEKVLLLKPMTYMNCSGRSLRKAADFFKVPVFDLLVVCDDLNLPVGKLRLRANGSAGGQNGLKDIIACLGTEEFPRLRLGIGRPNGGDAADYVLSDVPASDRKLIVDAIIDAGRAVETWSKAGIAAAMNQFNSNSRTEE